MVESRGSVGKVRVPENHIFTLIVVLHISLKSISLVCPMLCVFIHLDRYHSSSSRSEHIVDHVINDATC